MCQLSAVLIVVFCVAAVVAAAVRAVGPFRHSRLRTEEALLLLHDRAAPPGDSGRMVAKRGVQVGGVHVQHEGGVRSGVRRRGGQATG